MGEQASNLLGSLLLSQLQLIAMARSELAPEWRAPFFVHVDEFQSFSTDAFASLLSEARKFALHFALANQYTEQLSDAVRAAVLGNAGTLMVCRVSAAVGSIATSRQWRATSRLRVGTAVFLSEARGPRNRPKSPQLRPAEGAH